VTHGAPGHEAPHCPRCGNAVALSAARPRINNLTGKVELWCARCPDEATVSSRPPPAPLELARTLAGAAALAPVRTAPPPRSERMRPATVRLESRVRRAAPLAASAAVVLVVAGGAFAADSLRVERGDQAETAVAISGPVTPAPAPAAAPEPLTVKPLGVTLDGEPIEDRYPTLAGWVHPIRGTTEPLPENASRRFGAKRDGKRPAECGRGHCGVDLSGDVGTPILSVADGVVAQIHRSSGGRGGRYIRIQHPDDTISSYFHLDSIVDELRVGDEVTAGQQLGGLGRSGIKVSGPHLHFGVAISDGERLRNIDPQPFLERALIEKR
jgi:murein DD-endopeptidase MepM/ murein hydrolase activator NlpD